MLLMSLLVTFTSSEVDNLWATATRAVNAGHESLLCCAQNCAQTRSKTIIRQPTPTKPLMKNGPEIIDFRPVL